MPGVTETIVFDPPELAPGREPLGLDELGIYVDADGADWGESKVAIQLARKQVGSVVTDRHLEPVEMSIPLHVREDSGVSLAEAAHRLQSKVGIAQADEYDTTWIRRDFDDGFGAAGSVAYQVHTAALQGLEGWLMAHRRHADEVRLDVLRSPLCYATEEIASEVFSVENARALEFELEDVLGTGMGLISLRVTNNGVLPWRAVVAALESRDHPQDETKDTTAALIYEAEDLTLSGGAEVKAREGASGGNVVRAELTAGWITILSGTFTHVGLRELWLRVWAEAAGAIELRAQYRPLGALRWSETYVTAVPQVAEDFSLLDMGQARAERASIGDQRWEVRILGRAPGGSGVIDLDQLRVDPVEHCAVVRAPYVAPQADLQQTKLPGKAENKTGVGTKAWTGAENVKALDANRATVSLGAGETSNYIAISSLAFSLPEGAEVLGVVGNVWRSQETVNACADAEVRLTKAGEVVGDNKKASVIYPLADALHSYGGSNDLWGELWTPAEINASGFGFALRSVALNANVVRVNHMMLIVYYTQTEAAEYVCYQSRSIDFRTAGVFRQHPEDDVWGELVNEGFNLLAPPSYIEGRALRGLIVPSAGDLDALADSGDHDLEAQVFCRPAYHFAREAAS